MFAFEIVRCVGEGNPTGEKCTYVGFFVTCTQGKEFASDVHGRGHINVDIERHRRVFSRQAYPIKVFGDNLTWFEEVVLINIKARSVDDLTHHGFEGVKLVIHGDVSFGLCGGVFDGLRVALSAVKDEELEPGNSSFGASTLGDEEVPEESLNSGDVRVVLYDILVSIDGGSEVERGGVFEAGIL